MTTSVVTRAAAGRAVQGAAAGPLGRLGSWCFRPRPELTPATPVLPAGHAVTRT